MCGRGTSRSPKHKRSLSLHPCVVAPFLLAAQPLQQPLGPCQCSPHCRCATCNRGNADVGRDATASSTPRSLSALLQLRVVSLSHTHTHMHSVSLSTHAHIAMLTPSYDVHDVLVFGPLAGLVATPLVTRVCQLWPHVSGHKGSLPSNDSSTCCPLPPSPSTLSLSLSLSLSLFLSPLFYCHAMGTYMAEHPRRVSEALLHGNLFVSPGWTTTGFQMQACGP